MHKLLLLSAICVATVYGATIKSVEFKGLKQLSQTSASEISGLKPGVELNDENINKAISNLFEQGYFDNAYVVNNNNNLVIFLQEKPVIAKLNIDGIATNDREKMEKIIGIAPGQFYDDLAAARAKERVGQFYELQGYFDTVSEFETKPMKNSDNSIEVDAIVNRGENIIIKNINLIGAKKFSYSDFEPTLANKKRELFGWMWGLNDGKLKINELANDVTAIKEEYLRKGYLDANVSLPYLTAYKDNYTADMTYYIQEGLPYKVNDISINAPEFLNLNNKNIISDFKLSKNRRMNVQWLRTDIQSLKDIVADKGYAYTEVIPHVEPVKELDHKVNITYEVIPNDKIYIRNLTIVGNEKTADRVIRREMYLTEGQLYNGTDLSDSLNALKRTGYFDDVKIDQSRVDKTHMDLIVTVKEAPTGSITGGIGYGSADGLLLNASVGERNIFGSGLTGEIAVDKSKDKLGGRISLTNPRIFDSQYSLGGTLYASNNDWDDYKVRSYGLNLNLGRQIGRYTNVYLAYRVDKSKITGVDDFYKAAGYRNGKTTKSSLIPGISFNNTDDFFMPRKGVIANASLEYAGIGGNIKYTELDLGFKWFYGLKDLTDWDIIFRYRASASYIWNSNPSKLPANEKLFLGGLSTIRGFDSRSLPKKEICLQGKGCKWVDVGGKKSFNNSFELSFPVIDRLKLRAVAFFDYGMVGENSFNDEKRYSAGAGIEWSTPVGMLQLYWAKPFKAKPYDETSRFEFSIGQRF